jgi:hypothetical protein
MTNPTFEILKESLNQEFKVTTDSAIATGAISSVQGVVTQVSGTVFAKDSQGNQGDYIANFNGDTNDGSLKWNISKTNRETAMLVWDIIEVIEANFPDTSSDSE